MTEIGGGWYMEKNTKGLLPLRRPKLSKNHNRRRMKLKYIYMNLIGGRMIGNYNYIGASLNGLIEELKLKVKTLFGFFKN